MTADSVTTVGVIGTGNMGSALVKGWNGACYGGWTEPVDEASASIGAVYQWSSPDCSTTVR